MPGRVEIAPMVFILAWERPIYLWVCLDSLFRHTHSPARFVITDNASKDPAVGDVIRAFEAREMFHHVTRGDRNDPRRFEEMISRHWDELGEFFVLIEGDIEVLSDGACWLETLVRHMESDERIGAIGSRVYQKDFVSLDRARALRPELSEEDLSFLVKADAPMRRYVDTDEPLIAPHNPPLRLLMLRKEAYAQVGFGRDTEIHEHLVSRGWKSLISTKVVHRHLSLLNIYDYPDYSRQRRDQFFAATEMRYRGPEGR